jgi:hypothetical protein
MRLNSGRLSLPFLVCFLVSACGWTSSVPDNQSSYNDDNTNDESIIDLFNAGEDPNVTVEVNKYIWNAALDVLDFMPIQEVDPFSGIIVYGYGTVPGSGRSYRATVFVQDPALDARSLRVALATRAGPADQDTVRAVEDAILSKARELRLRDSRL